MNTKKIALRILLAAALLCLTLIQPVSAYQSPEAQSFMSGFNSFKNKDYRSAIKQFSTLLAQPESQLRELTLVFLARSYFREGNTDEAAYLLHLWKQEFPASTLTTTVEQELLNETARSDIKLILAKKEQERIAREKVEQEMLAAIKAEEDRKAREKAEAERLAREKAANERLANHKASIYSAANSPRRLASYPAGELTAVAGIEMKLPLTITNPGVMPDSFNLATRLPAGWKSRFEFEGKQVSTTPEIAPGYSAGLILAVTPPVSILEGQQLSVPLLLTSRVAGDSSITSEIPMVASAPVVRAVVKKLDAVDGNPARAQCLISVLNVGSAAANTLSISITHPASHTPVAGGSAAFRKISGSSIRIGQLSLASGGLQEFLINFELMGGKPAKEGISCKAELVLE